MVIGVFLSSYLFIMVSTNLIDPVAKGFLMLTNILSSVRIDKLVVPEVIASDCGSAALECQYTGAGSDVTVRWLLNGAQVYVWGEGAEPRASGVLKGRIDLSHRISSLPPIHQHALRLIDMIPEMSGEYTCVVQSREQEARQAKNMTVFSPEHELELTFSRLTHQNVINLKCTAKHLYPQPDLTIEYNKVPISQQQQRIWRYGSFYDAECTAVLSALDVGAQVSCRLQIPQVDYTAITMKFIDFDKEKNGSNQLLPRVLTLIILTGFLSDFL